MGGYMGVDMTYLVLTGITTLVGMWVQRKLKSKFNKYSQIGMRSGLTGADVAQQMLQHYGVHDVQIVQGQGMLTDHYNPMSKTVSLSPAIYSQPSIMAAAVAAHEVGHAIQHATGYSMLKLRSGIVPLVSIASKLNTFILGIALMAQIPLLIQVAIVSFGITTLFALITLPVEFDATRRGLAWLDSSGVSQGAEYDGAKDALKWAAMTYVSAALSSLVMLLYLILRMQNSRR